MDIDRMPRPVDTSAGFFRLIEEGRPWQQFPIADRRAALDAFRSAVERGSYCHLLMLQPAHRTATLAQFPGMWSAARAEPPQSAREFVAATLRLVNEGSGLAAADGMDGTAAP